MGKPFLERLFWMPNYFTIAIRKKKKPEDHVLNTHKFVSDLDLTSSQRYWKADPMLIEDGENTYLFYEACHDGKGLLEVVQIKDDLSTSEPAIILEKEYHLSYPYVFKYHDEWYMIPESCACNKVQLYKALNFPLQWEYTDTILEGYFVDTTVVVNDDKILLETFGANQQCEAVNPYAYYLSIENGQTSLEALDWFETDEYRTRGAGQIWRFGNQLYRPAQLNQPHSYGDGVIFKKLLLDYLTLEEADLFELLPQNVTFKRYKFDGLHTYTSTTRYEAIDVRCSFFDILKPLKKIMGKI